MNDAQLQSTFIETIHFNGHPNILATHYNTLEVTRAAEISRRADCIIGVNASKACSDLQDGLKRHIRNGGNLFLTIEVGNASFSFEGRGMPTLSLTNSDELVLRKSDFASDRTAAVLCSAAALDLPREMIQLLQLKDAKGCLTIKSVPSSADRPKLIGASQ
jgi:hypothetical protein